MFSRFVLTVVAICVDFVLSVDSQDQLNPCGISVPKGNKLTNTQSDIGEFPWLALIEYLDSNGKLQVPCEGTLIHAQYVLTAGHCMVQENLGNLKPTNVRLGEYDTATEADCIDEVCNAAPVVIAIKDVMVHPEYDPKLAIKQNDIALIRLVEPAPYTDFVRPICLPTADVTPDAASGSLPLLNAGWGAYVHRSNVKQFAVQVFKNFADCQESYAPLKQQVFETQICASGEDEQHSCQGGPGGSLMMKDPESNAYIIHGLLSYGPPRCETMNVPDVFTKVYSYLDFILPELQI